MKKKLAIMPLFTKILYLIPNKLISFKKMPARQIEGILWKKICEEESFKVLITTFYIECKLNNIMIL